MRRRMPKRSRARQMLTMVPAAVPAGCGFESWPGERTGVTGQDPRVQAKADAGSLSTHRPAGRAAGSPGKLFPIPCPELTSSTHSRGVHTWKSQLPAGAGFSARDARHWVLQAALPVSPRCSRGSSPVRWLTHDSGPGAGPESPETGVAEVQVVTITGDTHRRGGSDFGTGGEVPAPQLPTQLPAPLGSLSRIVTQHVPLPIVKDLDVPFARRGAGRQPPQGPGLGAWGREAERGSDPRGDTTAASVGLGILPARGPPSAGTSSWHRDAHGISASPCAAGTRGIRASRTGATR